MNSYFDKIKNYLLELDFDIIQEDKSDGFFLVENEENGLKNIVLILADPILIIEQLVFELHDNHDESIATKLLIKNRDIIHGAFVLDETGRKVFFRNTHECKNLDLNEIEATLNSLALLLSEYSTQLIEFNKQEK